MEETADYFRRKAEQCRRLAGALVNPHDPAVANILALAVEFEAKAVAIAAEEAAEKQIDSVAPERMPLMRGQFAGFEA